MMSDLVFSSVELSDSEHLGKQKEEEQEEQEEEEEEQQSFSSVPQSASLNVEQSESVRTERLLRVLRMRARVAPSRLAGEERARVVDTIARAVSSGAARSVVIEGPAGSGKSTAVSLAVARAAQEKGGAIKTITLRGCVLQTQEQAFRALAQQLSSENEAADDRRRNAVEARTHIHDLLEEQRDKGMLTVVVLEQAEVFALQPRQELLYMLSDMSQDASFRVTVLMVTQQQDFVSRLEKRVESRIGTLRVVMPPLRGPDAKNIVLQVISPEDDGAEFAWWLHKVQQLKLDDAVEFLLRFQCSNVRLLIDFAWTVVALDGNVDAALEIQTACTWKKRLQALSEVEMCVLGCIVVHNKPDLQQAYEYFTKLASSEVGFPRFSKQLFERAFASLASSVDFADWPKHLVVDAAKRDTWPQYINAWIGKWLE